MTALPVQTIENQPLPPASYSESVLAIIDRAARDPAVNIERLQQLLSLKERIDAEQARKEFNAAVASAKGEIPVIRKNREVDFTSAKGRTNYVYEDFAGIAETVDPILKKHGLAYRFLSRQDGQRVAVTCVLFHAAGHSEETTLTASEDHTGNKNSIQAIASATTYLQRYTLKLALGLAASKDDDGARSEERDIDALIEEGEARAQAGVDALQSWWTATLNAAERKAIGMPKLNELKKIAQGEKQ